MNTKGRWTCEKRTRGRGVLWNIRDEDHRIVAMTYTEADARAISQLPELMEPERAQIFWRPMSEAPRDATTILAVSLGGATCILHWFEGWWAGHHPADGITFLAWMPVPVIPKRFEWEGKP